MSSQKEVYRQKQLQEKFQAILNGLLRDEDNKYCVDCDAKGPRWASWNIGIFLCIRCAGIHRNLGTHISKVKSVNLDTWSPDQVESMTEMGNSRARAVYEANLPDGFRRPQTDSSLEAFIRQKYEQKRYIAKEWVPPARPTGKAILLASEDADKKKPRSRPTPKVASEPYLPSLVAKSRQRASSSDNESLKMPTAASVNKENNSADLLGLDDPSPKLDNSDDLFGGFLGAPAIAEVQNNTLTNTSALDKPKASSHNDLESLFGSEGQQVVQQNIDKSQSTKDSILSLYGNNSYTQPQTYGVPVGSFYPGQQQPVASFTDFAGMTAQPPSNSHFPTDPQVALGGMYVSPQQMAVGYPNGAPQMAPAPQANMGMQGVMGQQMAMGGVAPSMYGNQFQQQQQQQQHQQQQQQQQQHLQQVQQQLAGIKMANPNVEANIMNNAPQWNAMPSGGQTLSTNLWQ